MVHCLQCLYIVKSPHTHHIVFTCRRWGLQTLDRIPSLTVASSIGRECPFFTPKNKQTQSTPTNHGNPNNLDIFI